MDEIVLDPEFSAENLVSARRSGSTSTRSKRAEAITRDARRELLPEVKKWDKWPYGETAGHASANPGDPKVRALSLPPSEIFQRREVLLNHERPCLSSRSIPPWIVIRSAVHRGTRSARRCKDKFGYTEMIERPDSWHLSKARRILIIALDVFRRRSKFLLRCGELLVALMRPPWIAEETQLFCLLPPAC
jgi:hypothetical protein